jgi:hypothetical protein
MSHHVWKIIMVLSFVLTGCSRHRWASIQVDKDGNTRVIGRFNSEDACAAVTRKVGGWCGQDCVEESPSRVTQCKPLIKVPVPTFQ